MKKRRKSRQAAMTDKPKPWPYAAARARDRSAEELQQIVFLLTPLLDSLVNAEAKLKVARSLIHAQLALRHLESQGAQTRPD